MLNHKEISEMVLKHQDDILENIGSDEIEVYCFLKDRFADNDVSEDLVFQYLFRKFFVMDRFLKDDFKIRFFEVMQEQRATSGWDNIPDVCDQLYSLTQKLQFSFVTKMFHFFDDGIPIYDSLISKAFRYYPRNIKLIDQRINKHLDFLRHVKNTYNDIQVEGLLDEVFEKFNQKFSNGEAIGITKKMDFLIWGLNRK